jgi:hypothetical protein
MANERSMPMQPAQGGMAREGAVRPHGDMKPVDTMHPVRCENSADVGSPGFCVIDAV